MYPSRVCEVCHVSVLSKTPIETFTWELPNKRSKWIVALVRCSNRVHCVQDASHAVKDQLTVLAPQWSDAGFFSVGPFSILLGSSRGS